MKLVCTVALTAMMVVPAIAEDVVKEKKGKGSRVGQVSKVLIKQLKPVGLTEEQAAKITELGKTLGAQISDLRKSAGITPEITKKLGESRKSLRESGKKGKELMQAINDAAGISEAQVAALKTIKEKQMAFRKDALSLLTEEQKEKLPKKLSRAGKPGKDKRSKKKKDDA